MEENLTVQQLSQALNQLLDAYENLQKKNTDLKKEIEDLQFENEELKEQVSLLSSTTSEQNGEMDAMINRIESILGGSVFTKEEKENLLLDDEDSSSDVKELVNEKEEESTPTVSISKEQPDLGRMQALLNGFNS